MSINLVTASALIRLCRALNIKNLAEILQQENCLVENYPNVQTGILISHKMVTCLEKLVFRQIQTKLFEQLKILHNFYLNNGLLIDNVNAEVYQLNKSAFEASGKTLDIHELSQYIKNLYQDWLEQSKFSEEKVEIEKDSSSDFSVKIFQFESQLENLKNEPSEIKILTKLNFLVRDLENDVNDIYSAGNFGSKSSNRTDSAKIKPEKYQFLPTNIHPVLDNLLNTWPIKIIVSKSDELILKTVFRIVNLCKSLLFCVIRWDIDDLAKNKIIYFMEHGQVCQEFSQGYLHKLRE